MKTNFVASASELRSRAWNAMTATWSTVLWITIALDLASLAVNYILFSISIPIVSDVLSFAATMFLAIARMGLTCGALTYLRRGHIAFEHIGSMLPYWKQIICYYLWQYLFLFLWMLPGLVVTIIGLIMQFSAYAAYDRSAAMTVAAARDAINAGTVVMSIGFLLALVLALRAGLNYLAADCCIIDKPDMGGRAALAKSKQLMRGNRWRYIRMCIPVMLMSVLILFISYFLSQSMDARLSTFITSALSIAPEVMAVYLIPVLYQELNDRV